MSGGIKARMNREFYLFLLGLNSRYGGWESSYSRDKFGKYLRSRGELKYVDGVLIYDGRPLSEFVLPDGCNKPIYGSLYWKYVIDGLHRVILSYGRVSDEVLMDRLSMEVEWIRSKYGFMLLELFPEVDFNKCIIELVKGYVPISYPEVRIECSCVSRLLNVLWN